MASAIQQPNRASAWLLRLLVLGTSNKKDFGTNHYWISQPVQCNSQHYIGLIMRPSFCHPPPHSHKKGHNFLFYNKMSAHHSCSLHPGTTQSAKQRSSWDAQLPSVNSHYACAMLYSFIFCCFSTASGLISVSQPFQVFFSIWSRWFGWWCARKNEYKNDCTDTVPYWCS